MTLTNAMEFGSLQVLLLNIYNDLLVVLTADCHITVYHLTLPLHDKGNDDFD